jgi:lipid-binding SYLF domain-containing protein
MVHKSFLFALFALFALAANSTSGKAASAREIDAGVHHTLDRFFEHVRGGRELANKAAGVLVFPSVVKAGFGIGGEYGEGGLLARGRAEGYYNTVAASFGFQLGVEERSIIIMFMDNQALEQFRKTDGWKIGADASVVVIKVGAGESIDTNKITSPVVGFILAPKGLMYNLTLEGTKVSRISR